MAASEVYDLAGLDADAFDMVGGKAANLGLMITAGFAVPPGFCVGTMAYAAAAERAGVADLIGDLDAADPEKQVALSARIREALVGAPIPAELAESIGAAYAGLGEGGDGVPVAVRSSATSEDIPFASAAGQHDTYLNVVGRDDVLAAVRRCWASLWTDRAVSYRGARRIDHRAVRLAVVVQRMIDPVAAGVLFTANPVTGTRNEAVVDANPGLGEAVVSGAVVPDHFELDGHDRVLRRRVGGDRQTACLTDAQLRDLARLGRKVEGHFGAPQDIEWALDAGAKIWLTQTRPITTLFPVPEPVRPGLRVYFSGNVAQGVYQPFTPMGLAAIRAAAGGIPRAAGFQIDEPLDGPPALVDAAGRLFIDLTVPIRSTFGRDLVPRLLNVMEARSAVIFAALTDDPRLSVTDRSRWHGLRRVARAALHVKAPVWAAEALFRPNAARRRAFRRAAEVERLTRPPADTASAQARIDDAVRVLTEVAGPRVTRLLPVVATVFGLAGGVAPRLLGSAGSEPELRVTQRGIPFNVTTEMDLELGRLARAIRTDPDATAVLRSTPADELSTAFRAGTLPVPVQRGVAEFLARYGHRAVAEIDLGLPRWSEDPTHVFGVLVNYLRVEDESWDPQARFVQGAAEAEAMVAELVARTRKRYGPVRAWLLGKVLDRYRALAGVRELPKFCLVLIMARARAQLAEVGETLAAAGRLGQPDDVFFLDLREARAAVNGSDLRELVHRRRADYERELLRRHVPRILLSDGTEPEASLAAAAPVDPNGLAGTAASAGTVTGPARVVLDPVGAHLSPGEILVAQSTDPGWTPLFLTAGGLVMEMGGPNSHGAVVAREYGIPAVVGVPDATTRITTGQRITVNGAAGTVSLVSA